MLSQLALTIAKEFGDDGIYIVIDQHEKFI
jgi:hypothetical protein